MNYDRVPSLDCTFRNGVLLMIGTNFDLNYVDDIGHNCFCDNVFITHNLVEFLLLIIY